MRASVGSWVGVWCRTWTSTCQVAMRLVVYLRHREPFTTVVAAMGAATLGYPWTIPGEQPWQLVCAADGQPVYLLARTSSAGYKDAETVAGVFFESYTVRFGVPFVIHIDQGRNFDGNFFQAFCDVLDCVKTRTTPYRPSSNGQIQPTSAEFPAVFLAR